MPSIEDEETKIELDGVFGTAGADEGLVAFPFPALEFGRAGLSLRVLAGLCGVSDFVAARGGGQGDIERAEIEAW